MGWIQLPFLRTGPLIHIPLKIQNKHPLRGFRARQRVSDHRTVNNPLLCCLNARYGQSKSQALSPLMASRKRLFSRVWYPGPLAFNHATTSASSRTVTLAFVRGFLGRPLPFFHDACSSGKTSLNGRASAKSAFVSSRTSPSLPVKGFFVIFCYLSLICFPQADDPDSIRQRRKADHV